MFYILFYFLIYYLIVPPTDIMKIKLPTLYFRSLLYEHVKHMVDQGFE